MKLEDLFEMSAKRHMIQFDLKEFQKTHPRLYLTIQEALLDSFNLGLRQGADLTSRVSLETAVNDKIRQN